MQYRLSPYNPDRYATNLRLSPDQSVLQWDTAAGQDSLILCIPYKHRSESLLTEVVDALSRRGNDVEEYGGFTAIAPDMSACFISAGQKGRQSGCPLNGQGRSYLVLACAVNGGTCEIFEPSVGNMMISPYRDVLLEVALGIEKVTRKGRGFFAGYVDTGYWSVTFPQNLREGYVDGSLQIDAGNLLIPITRRMVDQGTIYFSHNVGKDNFKSTNPGLRLV